jgi:hypothetical protein
MTNYSPTINPGDIRRRTRYIGIRTALNTLPSIEVLEQDVILISEGEVVLRDMVGSLPIEGFDPQETFELRNPETDELTGSISSVGEAMALIYSWVRSKQLLRDNIIISNNQTIKESINDY